ncbi:MAG: DUF5989 family protein [Planctomycetaceae bacterium]
MSDDEATEFARQAQEQRGKSPSIVREFAAFLRAEKKWWLAPLLLVLLLFAGLIALSGSAAAPFIYSLF